VREKASAELLALGLPAVGLLRQTAHTGNPRVAAHAGKLAETLDRDGIGRLPEPAPRLLALTRPEGALEAVLAFLPFADHPDLDEPLRELVASLGVRDGKPEPAVLAALADPLPARRAAAGVAVVRSGHHEDLPRARKLLQDAAPVVRWHVGRALVERNEKSVVPALIALLTELPLEQAWEVEELLCRLAGEKAPAAALTSDPAVRAGCRDQWSAWWRDHAATVNLAAAREAGRSGLLVVESYDQTRRTGRVMEIDRTGKARWEISGLGYPMHAQLLRGDRVLIAEQNGNRVTERDLAGRIQWQKTFPSPFHCQRLPNGHTFIAGRNTLVVVDRQGKEVLTHPVVNETILAATRLRDGQLAYVTYQGNYVRLDANGKQVLNVRVPWNLNFGVNGAEVLPGDRVLIAVAAIGKVTEYNAAGKVVWEATAVQPGFPHRLPNGRTVVTTSGNTRIAEFDTQGRLVQELKDLAYHPYRVVRR
jgi:hypothetical protein